MKIEKKLRKPNRKRKKGIEMPHTNMFLELENMLQFVLICLQTFL